MVAEVIRRLRQRAGDLREALAGEGDAVRDGLGQIFPDGMTARMDGRRWIREGAGSVTSHQARRPTARGPKPRDAREAKPQPIDLSIRRPQAIAQSSTQSG